MKIGLIGLILVMTTGTAFADPNYQGYNPSPQTYVTPTIQAYTPPSQPAPSYGNNGYGQGSTGYNGNTGQVNQQYVPAGANPNPPPNMGYGH